MVATVKDKKKVYIKRVKHLLEEYPRVLLANADNVTSMQFHLIRAALREKAVVLMGKNTMMKKALKESSPLNPKLDRLLPLIKRNVCLIFTSHDLNEIRSVINNIRMPAPALAGALAPCDVIIPAGPTGLEPTKTQFFGALNVATKISKSQVEILSDTKVINKGQKIGNSEATLLKRLKIQPFSYGLTLHTVYDNGSAYPIGVLDITPEEMKARFEKGLGNLTALALSIGYGCTASFPQALVHAFSNLVSITLITGYSFRQAEAVKESLAKAPLITAKEEDNCNNLPASSNPPRENEDEEESDSEGEMGFGLFGDD